jgi:hypothetical protein
MTQLQKGYRTAVTIGGQPVLVCDPILNYGGGLIVNPATLRDQLIDGQTVVSTVAQGPYNTFPFTLPALPIGGLTSTTATTIIPYAENLYVNIVEPGGLAGEGDTIALLPGQEFVVPSGVSLWANAATSGHAFTAFFYTKIGVVNNYPPITFPDAFPPSGPSGLTQAIPSYLYQEYSDDDDLQAFVTAENQLQQNYIDTFNAINLPIYTGPVVSGALLDWVGQGVYGINRPWLVTNKSAQVGPLNTIGLNQSFVPIDNFQQLEPNGLLADDDIYRRVITWHYQKGDGKYFSIRWLKRRIMRFLIGVNGTSPPIDQTDQISITFGAGGAIGVRFITGQRILTGGCIPNVVAPGALEPIDNVDTTYTPYPPLPNLNVFLEAIASGILEIPFQMTFVTNVG